ncbi:MAG: site-specific DNA-methyltransferase [Defluviitaleaceae bacterium]|nr:site-specific DNA-methyltransferase [Defluviitaleaceae bacterium]
MLTIETVKIGDIKPFKNNAKKHPQAQIDQIKNSIAEFGMNDPIAIDENNIVIEGHGRLLALRQMGAEDSPCIRLSHLTEAQKRAYIIAHNKLTLNTDFDLDILTEELEFLKGADFDVLLTGFSPEELDALFGKGKDEAHDDDFDVDKAASEPPFVLPRDLWLLGSHRLLCGDATNPGDMARLLDGKKVNYVLTDPPYGVSYSGKAGKIKNDDLYEDDMYKFLLASFQQIETAMANDAAIYVFYADSKGLIFRRAFADAGFYLSGNCVWAKNSFTLGRSDYQWQHEVCLYGWKKAGKHKWYGDRKQSTIWNCDKPKRNEGHPTVKPIPLLAIPLSNSTMTNSLVLDPFAGSFSTGICCDQLGRVCYGMELDPVYASVSVKRYVEQAGPENVYVIRDGAKIPYNEAVANA